MSPDSAVLAIVGFEPDNIVLTYGSDALPPGTLSRLTKAGIYVHVPHYCVLYDAKMLGTITWQRGRNCIAGGDSFRGFSSRDTWEKLRQILRRCCAVAQDIGELINTLPGSIPGFERIPTTELYSIYHARTVGQIQRSVERAYAAEQEAAVCTPEQASMVGVNVERFRRR